MDSSEDVNTPRGEPMLLTVHDDLLMSKHTTTRYVGNDKYTAADGDKTMLSFFHLFFGAAPDASCFTSGAEILVTVHGYGSSALPTRTMRFK
jgi:hypothetical protein